MKFTFWRSFELEEGDAIYIEGNFVIITRHNTGGKSLFLKKGKKILECDNAKIVSNYAICKSFNEETIIFNKEGIEVFRTFEKLTFVDQPINARNEYPIIIGGNKTNKLITTSKREIISGGKYLSISVLDAEKQLYLVERKTYFKIKAGVVKITDEVYAFNVIQVLDCNFKSIKYLNQEIVDKYEKKFEEYFQVKSFSSNNFLYFTLDGVRINK